MSNKEDKNNEFLLGAIVTGASALVGGIVGYLLATKNVVIELPKEVNHNINIQKEVLEIDRAMTLDRKIEIIHEKIHSNNPIEVQGAIIVLFSELEKMINLLIIKSKHVPKLNLQKRISQLFELKVIDNIEQHLLKKIVPMRNNLVHGKEEELKRDDIYGCEKIITEFLHSHK
jgi:hypothetical protein